VVTLSHTGYVKSQKLDEYGAQKRGGRGKQATTTKEDDFIEKLFIANTHDYVLCFSDKGKVYWIKVYEVPLGSRASRGKPIVNLLKMDEDERINAILRWRRVRRGPLRVLRYAAGGGEEEPRSPSSPARAPPGSSRWTSTRATT